MGAHAGRAYGQTWKEKAKTNNSQYIGIETCHPRSNGEFSPVTMKSLVWLCADLCRKWKLNPETDVVRHFDRTGKICPLFYVQNPNEWAALKQEVVKAYNLKNLTAYEQANGGKVFTSDCIQIVGKPTVTLSQMKEWSRNRGAAQHLLDLAPYYYQKGIEIGIDPAVAWVQTALETGDGRFPGGTIDATWMNTCGMKTTAGGGNNVPNAHHKFQSWEESVDAQFDHLALYAGMNGYPKQAWETKDPRHFTWIHGTAKTMQDLKGKWASDQQYDTKLVTLMNALKATPSAEGDKIPEVSQPPVTQPPVTTPPETQPQVTPPQVTQPPMQNHAPSEWARASWEWAKNNKITDGTNPTNTATREQVIQIIYNWQQMFVSKFQG